MIHLKVLILTAVAVGLGVGHGASPLACAQSRQLPKPIYYSGFGPHYRGDYKDALKVFRSAHRSAFRIGNQRYVDSVCSFTMMGETHYQIGDYAGAMQHYNDAIELYLFHHAQRWQSNIRVPANIRASTSAVQRAGVTWGTSARRGQVADLPDTLPVLRGRVDIGRVFQQGGLVDPAEIRAVNVNEVMRCLTLALRRRGMINGPAGKFDPLSLRAVAALKAGNVGNNTYLGALNGVAYGTALASVGIGDKAAVTLKASLQLSGGLDHALTSPALELLGEIALLDDNPLEAGLLALEGSYSAAWFGNYDMVEQSLNLATQAHLYNNRTVFAPLNNAITWARRENADMLETSLRVRLAECYSESGDFGASAVTLKTAGNLIGRRNDLDQSIIASRFKYLTALNQFLAGDYKTGLVRLKEAIAHLGTKSRSQYRLRTTDALAVSGGLTEKQADALYQLTLQDPSAQQWKLEPMEAIAFLVSPHVDAMQRWFTIAINRKDTSRSLQIADTIRRHRFYATLPLGGRLMSLRWVLHGDPSLLSSTAMKQRQQFLTRYSRYRSLVNQSASLKSSLETIELLPPTDSPEYATQKKRVANLVNVSNAQESMLASFALRREPAEMAFPPRVNPERIGSDLRAGQLAIVTLQTGDGYHLFTLDRNRTRYLGVLSATAIRRSLVTMCDAMGVIGNRASAARLDSEIWKTVVAEFQDAFLEDIDPLQLASTRELIVVPDGLFWYLPFESFFVDLQTQDQTFGEAMKIRYSPTLALAFARPAANKRDGKTGIVAGTLFPRTDGAAAAQFVDDWTANNTDRLRLPDQVIYPSAFFAWQMDQLVTFQQDQSKGAPFALTPMAVDTARFGTTLFEWMNLPLCVPHTVVLPGLNSVGGPSGKFRGDGSDLFLTSTALLASGSRSLLLSRWNSGGQMQMELAGRFAHLSRSLPMTDALQQSIAEIRELAVTPSAEPRVDFDDPAIELKGDHPLFWGGQILVALPETNIPTANVSADNVDAADNDAARGGDGGVVGGDLPGIANGDDDARKPAGDDAPTPEMVKTVSQEDESHSETETETPSQKETADDDEEEGEGAVWQIGGKKK